MSLKNANTTLTRKLHRSRLKWNTNEPIYNIRHHRGTSLGMCQEFVQWFFEKKELPKKLTIAASLFPMKKAKVIYVNPCLGDWRIEKETELTNNDSMCGMYYPMKKLSIELFGGEINQYLPVYVRLTEEK